MRMFHGRIPPPGGTGTATYFDSSDAVGFSHDQDREMTPHHEKRDGQDAEDTLTRIQRSECFRAVSGSSYYIAYPKGVDMPKPVVSPILWVSFP